MSHPAQTSPSSDPILVSPEATGLPVDSMDTPPSAHTTASESSLPGPTMPLNASESPLLTTQGGTVFQAAVTASNAIQVTVPEEEGQEHASAETHHEMQVAPATPDETSNASGSRGDQPTRASLRSMAASGAESELSARIEALYSNLHRDVAISGSYPVRVRYRYPSPNGRISGTRNECHPGTDLDDLPPLLSIPDTPEEFEYEPGDENDGSGTRVLDDRRTSTRDDRPVPVDDSVSEVEVDIGQPHQSTD